MNCPNTAPLIILCLVSIGANVVQLFVGVWLIGALIEERQKKTGGAQ